MAIVITKQPTNVAANVNDTVSFVLEATGEGLTYSWHYSTDNTKFYALSASSSASRWTHDQPTLTFVAYSGDIRYYFRCVITDASGNSVTSDIVRVINLAEADAGFIYPATMHDIAEAIRAKTETTDKILPAEMAAMIAAIETGCGGADFEYITYTPSADIELEDVKIPCSMTKAPTHVVIEGDPSIGNTIGAFLAMPHYKTSLSDRSFSLLYVSTGATWHSFDGIIYSNGSITFDGLGSGVVKLSKRVTFKIHMWRLI